MLVGTLPSNAAKHRLAMWRGAEVVRDAKGIGFCQELYPRRKHLWTFTWVEGIEPTNNMAERALRTAVIYRKLSFGTQRAIASIAIVMLTLLAMRNASRCADAQRRPAGEIISEDYIAVLSAWRHGKTLKDSTIHDFYFAMAHLGGHQNRKGDHLDGRQSGVAGTICKQWALESKLRKK